MKKLTDARLFAVVPQPPRTLPSFHFRFVRPSHRTTTLAAAPVAASVERLSPVGLLVESPTSPQTLDAGDVPVPTIAPVSRLRLVTEGEVLKMAAIPPWTTEVSDRLMDAQVVAERVVDADGVRTADEQAMLGSLYGAQSHVTMVHAEITEYVSVISKGRVLDMHLRRRRALDALGGDD